MLGPRRRQPGPAAASQPAQSDLSVAVQRDGVRQEFSSQRRCSCGRFCKVSVLLGVLLFLLVWAYPSPIQPVAFRYSNDSDPEMVGAMAVNEILKHGERIFENRIVGPEALVMDKEGAIYTGLADGRIIRIEKDLKSFSTVIWAGVESDECGKVGSADAELRCGRPLGLHFNNLNLDELYFVDSSHGLSRVNVKTKTMTTLVSKNTSAIPFKFMNDLVQLPNGSLMITDSSLKFNRYENVQEGLECGANGQLLVYNPGEGTLHVVMKGLHFPNGLSMAVEGQSILIVETTRARILRYYFSGERAGSVEIFSENLPCWADNIILSPRGTYWVGSAVVRSPVLNYFAHSAVFFRSILAKFHLVPMLEKVGLLPPYGLILEVDKEGKVIRSLHDKGGYITTTTSHILEIGDTILIGSYHAPYLIRLKL